MVSRPTPIKFGTDGWRALIAEDYNFANVRICAEGVCRLLKETGIANRGIVIGYDSRWGSPEFAEQAARVTVAHGIQTWLSDRVVPTPVLSYNLLARNAAAGIMITASHNSGLWNGFKYKPEYAGSASQTIVDQLEAFIHAAQSDGHIQIDKLSNAKNDNLLHGIEMAPPYIANLESVVNLDAIRNSGIKVGIDSMHGAGIGYFETILGTGATSVVSIRGNRNPAFPDMVQPEPIASNLRPSIEMAQAGSVDIVLANDGDADRLGIIDEKGNFISSLSTFALLCLYQLDVRELRGPLVRSLTQSVMIDKIANEYGVPIHRTPVGFKYVGQTMMEVDAIAAGEESGGFAFRGNIPERDGILSGLMVLDLMARTNKKPSDLVNQLFDRVGEHHYDRLDVELDPGSKRQEDIKSIAAKSPKQLGGLLVHKVEHTDGILFTLDGGYWGLIRQSGTEPLLRIYAEGDSPERVREILSDLSAAIGI